MSRNYIKNLETGKIELHFTKEEYQALSNDLKKELKSYFLFSGKSKAWVSRSKNNHYSAIRIAEKLGFTEEERKGSRLSFEEEIERKAEKAEARAERFEQYAANAEKRAENLQGEFNELRKDWSYITQPIIRGHKGSEAFGKRRDRIMARYEKGFEEYRKSEYFKERAESLQNTAELKQFENKTYLNNRIKESKSLIKKLEKNIVTYEEILYKKENNTDTGYYNKYSNEQVESWLTDTLDKMEYEMDKLAFLENKFDEIGGDQYSNSNIKPGYLVKIRGHWDQVIKVNRTTVQTQSNFSTLQLKYSYAEIQDMKIPEDWKEEKKQTVNPFEIGDILTRSNIAGNRIIAAFQVVKVTSKSITIQQIEIQDNKPVKDQFIKDKQERRQVKQDRQNNFVVNDGDWYLYKYTEKELVTV